MIGRDEELDLLEVLFSRTLREHRPSLCTVVGPAGIGKSRLSHEFGDQVERGGRAQVVRGRCLPYGEGLTYWPMAEILRADAGIMDNDPPESMQEKALARLEPRWAADERAAGSSRVLLSSIGVPVSPDPLAGLDPAAAKESIARAWRFYFEARAAEHPVVALLEDLHWADASLLDLIEHLAGRVAGALLLVCMARPELGERRPGWGGGLRSSVTLPLDPLSAGDGEHLLRALLDGLPAPEEAIGQVLERSEGNPFYAQELLRMLIDGGVLVRRGSGWDLDRPLPPELPDTIQGVIASRLDLLPPEEKRALQDAAVVGRLFWEGAVERIGGEGSRAALDALAERGLVSERPSSAVAGDREFIFNHILTRDVAYASTPKSRRARAHAAALDWSEAMMRGREEEFAELLAYHAELAGDLERTARYGMLAGHRSRRVFAAQEAIAWYDRAQVAAEQLSLDPVLAEIAVARGEAYEQLGRFPEAHADYERSAERASAAGERELEARALAALAHVYWLEDRFEEGQRVQEHALEVARTMGDQPLLVRLLYTAGTLAFGQGRYRDALANHEEGLAVSMDAADPAGEALARHGLCETLYFLGPLHRALEEGIEADRLFRQLGQRPMVYHNLYMVAWLRWLKGDLDRALAESRESVEGNRELGNRRDEGFALGTMAEVLTFLGRLSEGLRAGQETVRIAREIGTPRLEVTGHGFRMMLLAELGLPDEIEPELETSFRLVEQARTNFFTPRLSSISGLTALRRGHIDRARELFRRSHVETGGVLLDELFCLQFEIVAWEDTGEWGELRASGEGLLALAEGQSELYVDWARYALALAAVLGGDAAQGAGIAAEVAASAAARMDHSLEWRALWVGWRAARALGRHWDGEVLRARAADRIRTIAGNVDPGPHREGFLARPQIAEVLGGEDGSDVFGDLGADDLQELLAGATERSLVAGEELFDRGDAGDELFLIDAGRVAVTVPGADGASRTVATLGPGEVLGEVALLDEGARTAGAVAETDARLLALGRDRILRLLEARPAVVERLIALLGERLNEGEGVARADGPPDVAARLARAVQRLAEREGRAGSTVEILPVFVRDGELWWLRPFGEPSWNVPGASGSTPARPPPRRSGGSASPRPPCIRRRGATTAGGWS